MDTINKDDFFKACRKGDIGYLEKLLKEDKILEQPNITVYNILDDYEQSPLFIGAKYGKLEVVKLLLDYGFDPNFEGENYYNKYTPIGIVCYYHNPPTKTFYIVELLLKKGADPNKGKKPENSPLYCITENIFGGVYASDWNIEKDNEKMKIFKLLLDYGVIPYEGNKHSYVYDIIFRNETLQGQHGKLAKQMISWIEESKINQIKPVKK